MSRQQPNGGTNDTGGERVSEREEGARRMLTCRLLRTPLLLVSFLVLPLLT